MSKPEEKSCPRCHAAFECKVDDITQCQCYGIRLTPEEKSFIEERYEDCLCRKCLNELQQRYTLTFITGGARSGKSRYAQELALQLSGEPVYVATSRKWDDAEFRQRILRHQQERDHRWTLLEEEKFLGRLELGGKVVVIDCVTLWLTNFFIDLQYDVDACMEACRKEIDELCRKHAVLLIISNEIGMGVHAETEMGRKFTDLQGWMNQYIAKMAGTVVLMVSGIPVIIKNNK